MTMSNNLRLLARGVIERRRQSSLWLRENLLGRAVHPLLFEHVPKCGGTSACHFLKEQYLPGQIFEIAGMDVEQSHREWREWPDERRFARRLLLGHGAHKLRQLFHPGARRLTVLRDPVDRVISHYHFARTSPNHYLFQRIADGNLSLIEYASSDLSPEIRNNYARRFAGISVEESAASPAEAAGRTVDLLLAEYTVIGFTDMIDLAMQEISRQCAFPFRWLPERRNVNPQRPREIDESTLSRIRELNEADLLIWNALRERAGSQGCIVGTRSSSR
jgi:hypothetical protein